jgi:UDP-N-acetylmuramoyl-L-alanyl-D-glutamate--2,6-diaminopimelate ligase
MKYLNELLKEVEVLSAVGDLRREITGISNDSRKITGKNCFVAVKGFKNDGLDYLLEAVKRGAHAVITESSPVEKYRDLIDSGKLAWIRVRSDRIALSSIAAALYNNPTDEMYTVGITGTNGKTTVMSLIAAIFSREAKTAAIGTLGLTCGGILKKSGLTTPEISDMFEFLSTICRPDCRNLVMEASSVALKLHRLEDIDFSQAIFTNFSGDHLDFHRTMDDYFESKMILFKKLRKEGTAIINIDESCASRILERLKGEYITYGFSGQADVRPLSYKLSLNGIEAIVQTPEGEIRIESPLIGRVNLSNIIAAVASAVKKGISLDDIAAAVKGFKAVKGRLDVAYKNDFFVLIDYAHTDQALAALLQSLREVVEKRVIVVFGAGGSRDKTKRPRMGEAASRYADFVVVTGDNPRAEDPSAIAADIIPGFIPGFKNYIVELDREKAIKKALAMVQSGDLIVVAGKGHEDYQIFRDRTIHFDDYEVVRKLLKEIKNG